MWPTRGLGTPFLWATGGLGRSETADLMGSSTTVSSATGMLDRVRPGYTGGGQSNASGPPRPMVVKYLTGKAESKTWARGELDVVLDLTGQVLVGSDALGDLDDDPILAGRATVVVNPVGLVEVVGDLCGGVAASCYTRATVAKDDDNEILELLLL